MPSTNINNFSGQTGTGKTYSMLGIDMWNTVKDRVIGLIKISEIKQTSLYLDHEQWGIIPQVLSYLFEYKSKSEYEVKLKCTYIEIYNEKIYDLLDIRNTKDVNLEVLFQ